MINSVRFDLSDKLIHFFRNIELGSPNSPVLPEHMGWGNIIDDVSVSALFMLRCAIKQGRLWATWSYRNYARTIYGPRPAVCFTEMPIAAFLEAGKIREERGEAMSPYAIVFPKIKLFELGANPVIYGLDDRSYKMPSGNSGGPRMIDPAVFSRDEQYRFVTFNISSECPIDWSHEREWRWPLRWSCSKNFDVVVNEATDSESMPGLDFYSHGICEMGVVVKSRAEAAYIVHGVAPAKPDTPQLLTSG